MKMSSIAKNLLDHDRDPLRMRAQAIELDPIGAELLLELLVEPITRVKAWCSVLRSHLLEFFKSR